VELTHRQLHDQGSRALLGHARGGEHVLKRFFALRRREDGQTMAKYGVVLSIITLAVIASITLLSDNVVSAPRSVASVLPG
jgi:Flp pilus assembly pilin Flp